MDELWSMQFNPSMNCKISCLLNAFIRGKEARGRCVQPFSTKTMYSRVHTTNTCGALQPIGIIFVLVSDSACINYYHMNWENTQNSIWVGKKSSFSSVKKFRKLTAILDLTTGHNRDLDHILLQLCYICPINELSSKWRSMQILFLYIRWPELSQGERWAN